jgi:hypothetical protein
MPVRQIKETATRMLTNFSVQAFTNDFYTAQRVLAADSLKALPQVTRTWMHCMACCVLFACGGVLVAGAHGGVGSTHSSRLPHSATPAPLMLPARTRAPRPGCRG